MVAEIGEDYLEMNGDCVKFAVVKLAIRNLNTIETEIIILKTDNYE